MQMTMNIMNKMKMIINRTLNHNAQQNIINSNNNNKKKMNKV